MTPLAVATYRPCPGHARNKGEACPDCWAIRFERFSIYYELPGAGGGNLEFETLAEAWSEYDAMTEAYPDVYAQLKNPDGEKLAEHIGH